MEEVKFLSSGDSALTVEFSREISEEVNRKIRYLALKIDDDKKDGVIECVPTFRSLTVFFDPLVISKKAVCEYVKSIMSNYTETGAGEGRVLIRPSGTEPKVRVMIEGKDQKVIEQEARKLADLIHNTML